jgi:hypothetical protein
LASHGPPPSPFPPAAWDLDPEFFEALSRWTLDNPKSNSEEGILQRIFDGVGDCKELLGFIPDSPFPVRTAVGALAGLVKAGVVHRLADIIYLYTCANPTVSADYLES